MRLVQPAGLLVDDPWDDLVPWWELVSGALQAHGWLQCTQCELVFHDEREVGRLIVLARNREGLVQSYRLLCGPCAAQDRRL